MSINHHSNVKRYILLSALPYDVFLVFNCLMRLMGPLFVIGFYVLLGINIHGFFHVILLVIKKRLGEVFGLIWVAIGLSLVYNIVYNHFLATFLKPGSPKDLKVRTNYN
jgi:hypothetical protein